MTRQRPKQTRMVFLKEHIKASGMTQAALGEKAGLSQPELSRLVNSYSYPRMDTLKRLVAALGVSVPSLFSIQATR
jgi:transcriptional regulator with XRE-family HTH domain